MPGLNPYFGVDGSTFVSFAGYRADGGPTHSPNGGAADSLDDAKAAFRAAWERQRPQSEVDPNSAGGVRIAGLGALWQATILGFTGLDLMGDTLGIDPRLPPQWRSLSFRVSWRGRSVAIRIVGSAVEATLLEGEPMDMRIAGATRKLTVDAPLQVAI
jgi:trehalose/maltose hydrolase-like predicted phosphorylase